MPGCWYASSKPMCDGIRQSTCHAALSRHLAATLQGHTCLRPESMRDNSIMMICGMGLQGSEQDWSSTTSVLAACCTSAPCSPQASMCTA